MTMTDNLTAIKNTEDLEELLYTAKGIILHGSYLMIPEKTTELRDLLLKAYSLGYDAAHADHVDGNLG